MDTLTPYKRLTLRLFVQAVRDAQRPGEWHKDAVEFLESIGAACLADCLGYDLRHFRKGVETLMGSGLGRAA